MQANIRRLMDIKAIHPSSAPLSDIAVIIPSYRSTPTLFPCLMSVSTQQTSRSYEVYVIHSGSEKIAPELLQTFPNVRFFMVEERWLPGKARNWAVQYVQSPAILFLDADCIVGQSWVEQMVTTAEALEADALGGGVHNATPYNPFAWTMHILEFSWWLRANKTEGCENFPTCNVYYKRSVLLEIGGFEEDLFPWEDTILNRRLFQQGYQMYYAPTISVGHIYYRTAVEIVQHNYRHGIASRKASLEYKLKAASLLEKEWPTVIKFSVVILFRWLRMLYRLITKPGIETILYLIFTPYVLLCLSAYAAGFTNLQITTPMNREEIAS